MVHGIAWMIAALLAQQENGSDAADASSIQSAFRSDETFRSLGPRIVTAAEARKHGWKWNAPKIRIEEESFTTFVPKLEHEDEQLALLVYISPSPHGLMSSRDLPPATLARMLTRRRMAYVGPNGVSNQRNPLERLQLALSAAHGMCEGYPIDRKRVVVAGLSGGGKMACLAGRYAPDIFCAVVAICGAGFHRPIPVAAAAKRKAFYPADMTLGSLREKDAAAMVRFAFITGGRDFNHDPTLAIESAYRKAGFETLLVDQPDLGHAVPEAEAVDRCLQFALGGNERR